MFLGASADREEGRKGGLEGNLGPLVSLQGHAAGLSEEFDVRNQLSRGRQQVNKAVYNDASSEQVSTDASTAISERMVTGGDCSSCPNDQIDLSCHETESDALAFAFSWSLSVSVMRRASSAERLEGLRRSRRGATLERRNHGGLDMVLSVAGLKLVVFQVLVKWPLFVPVHWVGRSVVCAGDDCPACRLRTPRPTYFLGVASGNAVRILESPMSLVNRIEEASNLACRENLLGMVIKAERSSKRECWRVTRAEWRELVNSEVDDRRLIDAVAGLYRLPADREGESAHEWLNRVRKSQAEILQASQLL